MASYRDVIDPSSERPQSKVAWIAQRRRVALVLAIPLVVASAWGFSFPVHSPGLFGAILIPLLLLTLWLAFVVIWAAVLWVSTGRLRSWSRHAFAVLWAPTLVLACGVAIVLFGASLHLRFALSESELLAVARDAPTLDVGEDLRAGLYTVRETERRDDGVVLLVTHECGFSSCGFAFAPSGSPRDVCEPYDEQKLQPFAGDWFTFVWHTSNDNVDC